MNENTVITRSKPLLESGIDDELFALDVEGGTCFSFNATATEIWQLLTTPKTLGALCTALEGAHDVDHATCLADTAAMIAMLHEESLVTLTPP
jgi:Coenzyme PQQ synthesis protein D (PqqD)